MIMIWLYLPVMTWLSETKLLGEPIQKDKYNLFPSQLKEKYTFSVFM